MPDDDDGERAEEQEYLQTRSEAEAIEAASFICPRCQRYVDPAAWWTHIEGDPYADAGEFEMTLFHRRCGTPVPEKNREWVTALRALYDRSPIKPGDYVRLTAHASWEKLAGKTLRVVNIETDDYIGVTEDDPYYVLDTRAVDPKYRSYLARRKEFEPIGRPYLNRLE